MIDKYGPYSVKLIKLSVNSVGPKSLKDFYPKNFAAYVNSCLFCVQTRQIKK